LENGVVVELGVVRQAVFSPMKNQRRDRLFRGPRRFDPAAAHAPMKGNPIENHDVGPTANDQTLDEIKAFQLRLPSGDPGQIPARGWRSATDPPLAVQYATTQEDPPDGPDRRNSHDAASLEFSMDGFRTELTQRTGVLQLAAEPHHQIFSSGRGRRLLPPSTTRAIRPIDPIQPLPVRSITPDLDRTQTDLEPNGNRSHRGTLPNRCDNGFPLLLFRGVFGF
jgi:hypothetical protein